MRKFLDDLKDLIERILDGGSERKDLAIIKADLLSIKTYFNIPDVRIGATQEQVDALGTKLTAETEAIDKFDAGLQQANSPSPPD